MTTINPPARVTRRIVSIVFAFAGLGAAHAQITPAQLEPFITTGTRTPTAASTLGTLVDQITAAELARQQRSTLAEALGGLSGTPLFASGANGALSCFLCAGPTRTRRCFSSMASG